MSTISNERVEFYATNKPPFGYTGSDINIMARELLALRKERERAEPVHDQDMCDLAVFEKGASACLVDIPKDAAEIICRGISAATGCMIDWHYVGGRVHIKALRTTPPAQPVAVPETLPCPVLLEPGLRFGKGVRTQIMLGALQRRAEYYAELEAMTPEQRDEHEAGIKEFASMLAAPSKPVAETDNPHPVDSLGNCQKCNNTGMADSGGTHPWGEPVLVKCDCKFSAGSLETDTTAQQFESLAGKVVGGSEGFECTPVADLYELLTKCGECYDYTTSAKVAAAWIKDGYSAREYVKLDRLQEALLFAAPEPCK